MKLFVNQDQYPPFVQEVGVRVAIHGGRELPKVEQMGFGLPTGKLAFVSVRKVSVNCYIYRHFADNISNTFVID